MILRGGGDYLCVTSSYDLFKLKLLPSTREVFENVLQIGRFWSGAGIIEIMDLNERSPKYGTFWADRADSPMYGRIILRSALSRGGLESTTAAAAWLDEAGQDAFNLDTWEAILRRLSLYQGRALITTTLYNLGWLKTTIYDAFKKGDPDIDVVQFKSTDNPAFSKDEFARAERTMQRHRFLMFYHGEFARPPGQIYHMFDVRKHKVATFDIPRDWPVYVGVDPGAVHLATVWLALDVFGVGPLRKPGVYYAFRESIEGELTTAQHVTHNREAAYGLGVQDWWGGAPSEHQTRWDWQYHGINLKQPVIGDFEGGVDRVASGFLTDKLVICESCAGLLTEVEDYRRILDENGEATEEVAKKSSYHRLDALRYVACALFEVPMPRPVKQIMSGGTYDDPQPATMPALPQARRLVEVQRRRR